jgi:hypothetical protein
LTRAALQNIPRRKSTLIWQEDLVVDPAPIEPFGETFEVDACIYTLQLNSTATNKIFPIMIVQKLDHKGED